MHAHAEALHQDLEELAEQTRSGGLERAATDSPWLWSNKLDRRPRRECRLLRTLRYNGFLDPKDLWWGGPKNRLYPPERV